MTLEETTHPMATALRTRKPFAAQAPQLPIDPFTPAHIKRLVAKLGSPLLIIDCERVRQQYQRLQAALPGVDLFYALKPLPHPAVVATLAEMGACFDLATSGEVGIVRELGIEPQRCVHTHPIKRDSDIRDALAYGIDTFVVDNPDEIAKFARYRSRARLLVRVSFRSPDAVCDLSRKFGCDPDDAPALLKEARRLGVPVRGFSFHVGSQAVDPAKHVEAIEVCIGLIERARREKLAEIDMLDIGGGFPVDYVKPVMPIEEFCAPLREALARVPAGIRIISEPGRYIAAPAAIRRASFRTSSCCTMNPVLTLQRRPVLTCRRDINGIFSHSMARPASLSWRASAGQAGLPNTMCSRVSRFDHSAGLRHP